MAPVLYGQPMSSPPPLEICQVPDFVAILARFEALSRFANGFYAPGNRSRRLNRKTVLERKFARAPGKQYRTRNSHG